MKRFTEFQLDPAHECLWRGGTRLSLTRKAFAVLNCLVEDAGRIVTKDALMERVWPGVYVGEENLKVYIRELRALLGDQAAKPTYIETHRDRGYCFIAHVAEGNLSGTEDGTESESICGRAAELARLHQGFKQACAGKRQVMFITGEPGIGKTYLVEAFLSQLTGRLMLRVGLGQCIESYHEQEAFYPVLEAFGRLLRDPSCANFATVLKNEAPTWLVQFPTAAKQMDQQKLKSEIVGAGRERMLREICDALEVFTSETPLVLVLEDLHWSDHSTLDFIAAIARRREPARLLLIATYRPVEIILSGHPLRALKSELCSHGQASELLLEFLPREAIREYLTTRFSSSIADLLAEEVHHKTSGNPLFVTAMMDHLVTRKLLVQTDTGWRLEGSAEQLQTIVPDNLIEIIQKQIEQLSTGEQEVLTAASVVGLSFSAAIVAAGLSREVIAIDECCDSLARRELFLRRAGLEELPDGQVSGLFDFIHTLHRDALYKQIGPISRVNLHQRIGRALERMWFGRENEVAAELARHSQESRDYSQVVRYLRLQAENAKHRYAYREAITLLELALQHTEKLRVETRNAAHLEVLAQLAAVHDAQADKTQAAIIYQTVADLAAQGNRRDIQIENLVNVSREICIQDPMRALEVAERALSLCDREMSSVLTVSVRTWVSFLKLGLDGWDRNLAAEHQGGIEWLRQQNQQDLMAQHAFGLAVLQMKTGDAPGALHTTSEALPLLINSSDSLGHFTARWMRGWAQLSLGRGGESLSTMRETFSLSEKNMNPFDTAMGKLFLGELHMEAFDSQAARQLCSEGLTMMRNFKSRFGMQRALVTSANAELESNGDISHAENCLSELADNYATSNPGLSWYWKMPFLCALTNLYLVSGDSRKARAEVEEFKSQTDGNVHQGWRARGTQMSALVALMESDFKRARADIAESLAIIKDQNQPLMEWRIHETAALVHHKVGSSADVKRHIEARRAILNKFASSFDLEDPLRPLILATADTMPF